MSGIRIANIPDIKYIVDIGLELLQGSVYNGIKPDIPKFKHMVASMMGSKKGVVYVVVDDENIPQGFMLGMIDELFFSRDRYATDVCMYVRKSYRAHAPAMVRKFVAWAKSKPRVKEISLGISSGMDELKRAGSMYESLGFEQVGGLYTLRVSQ